VISGNHDSPQRLGINGALLEATGVHLRTRVADAGRPILLAGDTSEVAVYAIPYLEPDAVRGELAAGSDGSRTEVGRSHTDVLTAALALSAADRARRDPASTVILAHGWIAGGAATDSERDISVGGVGVVPAALFDGFAYGALGHLHRPQEITPQLRYSGSALPYSFSESNHDKGTWLVDLAGGSPGTPADVRFVPTPRHRRLSTISGQLDTLLASPDFTGYESDFLAITLTDAVRPSAAMDRLRQRFEHVLTLTWEPPSSAAIDVAYRERLRGRSDLDIATDFVAHVRGTDATPDERALLTDAFTDVRRTGDAA
jgi:exonuclease SbcD